MATAPNTTSSLRGRLVRMRSSARYGRFRARAPRYAFVAFVVFMSLAGIRSVLVPPSSSSPAPASGPPVDYAEQSFALAFSHAYLTYDSARPEEREAALSPFASSGLELGAGYSPPQSGSQGVRWASVAQVQRPLLGGAIVTIAAKLSSAPQPIYLSVPVDRARSGAIYLAGYPSFVGPPLTTTATPSQGGEPVDDSEVASLVRRALANFLAGDAENLSADLADAATVTLPTNHLRLEEVDQLDWVEASEDGAVVATITATDPAGGAYTLRYEVGVGRVSVSDPRLGPGWRVTYVQTISQRS
jgi:Conjugative transposon protein TcpC